MTSMATVELPTSFVVPLATAAVRTIALAGAAAFGLAVFRTKTTSVRLFTWTAVLYAAFVMPVLQQVLPPVGVPAPAFLQTRTQRPALQGQLSLAMTVAPGASSSSGADIALVAADPATDAGSRWALVDWEQVAAGIYLSGLCFLLARLVIGLTFSRRLRRASQTIHDERLTTRFANHAQSAGLSFIPDATESEFISVPVTMGILHPAILFPSNWRDWDDAKLNAVVAHEMSHVARRDTLTQRVSLLHCTIFWFSPLAWWLDKHLADLVEQASDEAALSSGVDSKAYATTLLSFFEALQGAPRRVWWQGVSMASAGRAEQRVERILAWKGTVAMSLKKSIAMVVVLLAVPVVYLFASAQPVDRTTERKGSAPVLIAQEKTPASPASTSHAARSAKKSSSHNSYAYGYDDELHYAIVSGGDSLTMSGSEIDGEHIEELRKTQPGEFIWFERDGKSYIIRDKSTLDRAKALWAPQSELGKKQEELGKQQEELGKQQEALSGRMEQVHVKVPDLTKDIEQLQAKLKQYNSGDATSEQIAEIQSEIGELQEKIGESQSQAGEQQSKLGEEMGALGEKQGKLGEQQGELGRRQGELAEQASRKMKALLDESVTKGTAQIEK